MYRTESTNYGALAYGQWRAPSSNDGPCQLLASPGQWHMVFIAKKTHPQLLPPPSLMTVVDVSVQEAKTEGGVPYTCSLVGMLDLAACLPLVLHYPAGREGLGMYPAVFAPAQRFPRGTNCSSRPQKCTRPDPGTDVPPWCHVASSGTSLPLTAGVGSNRVLLLRTSHTLSTLHLNWHPSRGIGLTPWHYADRQSSWRDNELLQWGHSRTNLDPFPCNACSWTRGMNYPLQDIPSQ